MDKISKIFFAGHTGFVGSVLLRVLVKQGYLNIITRTHGELDLCYQKGVDSSFQSERPEYVFMPAGKVGGIAANKEAPADFIYDNICMALNVIRTAKENSCKKLLLFGSSSMYPRNAEQPIKEEYLLQSEFEKSNESYAIAKVIWVKECMYINED